MLEINGLETAYGQSQVLFGMELNVGKGEVVTLLGRNGMGKTTTLHSVMGLVPSRSGNIRFQGQELRELPSYQIAKTGLSLVPEFPQAPEPDPPHGQSAFRRRTADARDRAGADDQPEALDPR